MSENEENSMSPWPLAKWIGFITCNNSTTINVSHGLHWNNNILKFLVKQKFPKNFNGKIKIDSKFKTKPNGENKIKVNGSKTFKISDTMVVCSIQLVAIDYVPQFLSFLFRKAFFEKFFVFVFDLFVRTRMFEMKPQKLKTKIGEKRKEKETIFLMSKFKIEIVFKQQLKR